MAENPAVRARGSDPGASRPRTCWADVTARRRRDGAYSRVAERSLSEEGHRSRQLADAVASSKLMIRDFGAARPARMSV